MMPVLGLFIVLTNGSIWHKRIALDGWNVFTVDMVDDNEI